MQRFSGTFLMRAFEGPYSKAGRWGKDMAKLLEQQGRPPKKLYFWYTSCLKCVKA